MLDFSTITAVALDVESRKGSRMEQDNLANIIWHLLERGYQIFLISTKENDDLGGEDFRHQRLEILTDSMPPGEDFGKDRPRLISPETLWVTNDAGLQQWLVEQKLPFAFKSGKPAWAELAVRLGSLSELTVLLTPSGRVVKEIGQAVVDRVAALGRESMLIGVGGPSMSGYREFAEDLRHELQARECHLVELIDLTSIMEEEGDGPPKGSGPASWAQLKSGQWLTGEILRPFSEGRRVYVEELPPGIPRAFAPQLPLFLSEESILLVAGEMPFLPPLQDMLELSILLEVSASETTRRLYNILDGEPFDGKFTRQYMEHEGGIYRGYLENNKVESRADFRINAEKRMAFTLTHPAG